MMKIFLPYELALFAKEKGFDKPCFAMYDTQLQGDMFKISGDHRLVNYKNGTTDLIAVYDWIITAPTHQQVVDWLLEDHKIYVEMSYDFSSDEHKWTCVSMTGVPDVGEIDKMKWDAGTLVFGNEKGDDYYHVYNEGIKKALELL